MSRIRIEPAHYIVLREGRTMKRIANTISLIAVLALLMTMFPTAFAEGGAEKGKELILATGDDKYIQLPDEESYLPEFKTRFAFNTTYIGPSTSVERYPRKQSGIAMPSVCEGMEVTVLAEQNDMACIIYHDINNRSRAGWIWTTDLLEEFPGREFVSGEKPTEALSYRDDITLTWSQPGFRWLTTDQRYSILSEEVHDCLGFTFEYQLIAENTRYWNNILGPRKIYVKTHGQWKEVAEFPYPEFGTVKMQVWLDEPMDFEAIGTIAQCKNSEIFHFRQIATDFAFRETA